MDEDALKKSSKNVLTKVLRNVVKGMFTEADDLMKNDDEHTHKL